MNIKLLEMKMQDINEVKLTNQNTVTFRYRGTMPFILNRNGPRFMLVENETFTEDRDASPEEMAMIKQIFDLAEKENLPRGRGGDRS